MKIVAIHGLWKKSSVFDSFRRYFGADEFYAPDIDWGEDYLGLLEKYIKKLQPDVIIGYSYGGYAVQQLFEKNPNAARLCVLIAPVGPKGISWKGMLGCLTASTSAKAGRTPEKISTLLRIFPGRGKITKAIPAPTLIISGGEDRFVSFGDAQETGHFHKADCYLHCYEFSHRELVTYLRVVFDIRKWIKEKIR